MRTFVFDVLEAGGTDLRTYPYRVRRAVLQRLLDGWHRRSRSCR